MEEMDLDPEDALQEHPDSDTDVEHEPQAETDVAPAEGVEPPEFEDGNADEVES